MDNPTVASLASLVRVAIRKLGRNKVATVP